MNNLYLITGPAGVGKSTISKSLASALEKSVLIEGDDIYHLVVGGYVSPWKDGNHLKFFWKNCQDSVRNSIKAGYDVVFNYIISKKDLARWKRCFKDYKIKFVVLIVDEKTLIERDKQRPVDCQMGERSLILLREVLEENFDEHNILNSSKLNIKQTTQKILQDDRFLI